MDPTWTGRVVAATDGSAEGSRAVSYAAAEASRRHVALQVVHVVPAHVPANTLPVIPWTLPAQSARDVVDHAVRVAHRAAPDIEVSATVLVGSRVASIVREVADAGLLVMAGRRGRSLERLGTLGTVAGVTTQARCPVLVLPPGYVARSGSWGRVVAAVRSPEHAGPVLGAGFAEATRSGAHVLVVHVAATGSFGSRAARSRGASVPRAGEELVDELAALRRSFPEVAVEVDVVRGDAARLLVQLSREADRLVVGRPGRTGPLHHLGSTARAVLTEALCPVEVVSTGAPQPGAVPSVVTTGAGHDVGVRP